MNMMRNLAMRLSATAAAVAVAAVAIACSGDNGDEPLPSPTPARAAPASPTAVPGVAERVTLSGTLTIDGVPLETSFLGARVTRDGLVGACQATIPAVTAGAYQIEVAADAERRGCGAPGAQVLLWAYVDDTFVFSNETAPWPDGATANFDATFSAAAPAGGSTPVTELKGLLYGRDGKELPGGSVIEAYVGDVLCGVTSMPFGGVTEGYYTLIIAGPAAIPACADGATVTFRIDGEPAAETAVNDLGESPEEEHEVNLTLK